MDTSYLPALRFRALTRFYDPLLRATMRENEWKGRLVQEASLQPGHHVLDLGCGTATLALMLKRAEPEATVVGLDGDPDILTLAREKVAAAGLAIELREGMAFAPPFPPASFDRVVSSLLFHHLGTEDKRRTLVRAWELLRPGGTLLVADWGKPENALMRLAFLGLQVFDGFGTTADNVNGRLIEFMVEAGFTAVEERHRTMTPFGTLSLYRAVRDASD
jgi:ubiquinone/menaquinone biosynthesis C-methylase UbiE